jgi:hypothetical protein
MKLFKGLLAIVLIAMIVVSCESKKKDSPATDLKEKTETVVKMATKEAHVCNEDCKKNGCTAHKGDAKKCGKDCKKECCASKDHKCSDAKCSADCKDATCAKCLAKKAECKTKCATKKA